MHYMYCCIVNEVSPDQVANSLFLVKSRASRSRKNLQPLPISDSSIDHSEFIDFHH